MENKNLGACVLVLLVLVLPSCHRCQVKGSLVPFDQLGSHSLYLPGPVPDVIGHHVAKRSLYNRGLNIATFNVQSDIRYRYSCTYFTSTVVNEGYGSSEVSFHVVLPETGFISKFAMEIDGRTYEAYVKEKDVAKDIYNAAQSRGQTAGLVELNSRYSNVFNVNVNVHSRSSVTFNLTYEELLQRRLGRYEQVISITPNQGYTADNMEIIVNIEESSQIRNIVVPHLKFDELQYENDDVTHVTANTGAEIVTPASNRARIIYRPRMDDLDQLHRPSAAVAKFIVRYELEQEDGAGQVLVMNGYFVHFFSPPNLRPLAKHIVFVLDFSGSMMGRKIEQLKDAMKKILHDLKQDDYFNLIIFSDSVTHWTPESRLQRRHRFYRSTRYNYFNPIWRPRPIPSYYPPWNPPPQTPSRIQPYPASNSNIRLAEEFVLSMPANGGTNINEALQEGVRVTRSMNSRGENLLPRDVQSMILFLTDGEPTVGITQLDQIERNVRTSNEAFGAPIFSLAFGQEADFPFIKKVSLQNHGFARKIYEAADARLQLEGFYKEISSPLLRNVQFKYTDKDIEDVTTITFGTLYGGSEIITSGRIRPANAIQDSDPKMKLASSAAPQRVIDGDFLPRCLDCCPFPVEIQGCGRGDSCSTWKRPMVYTYPRWRWWCYPPPPPRTTTTTPAPRTKEDYFLERFWAYLTIKQLIDQDFAGIGSVSFARSKALNLALQYGFVTSLTSLVVVKPEEQYIADLEPVDYFGAGGRGQAMGNAGGAGLSYFRQASPSILSSSGRGSSMKMAHLADTSMMAEYAPAPVSASMMSDGGDPFGGSMEDEMDSMFEKDAKAKPQIATTRGPAHLDLHEIKWIQFQMGSTLSVQIETRPGRSEKFEIATTDKQNSKDLEDGSCVILDGPIKHGGKCAHLKDCVQQEFVNDFNRYQKSYFCEAVEKKTKKRYAGACCPV